MTEVIAPTANKLLAALPTDEFERIAPKLEEVDLKFGTKLFDVGELVEHIYFPTSSVATLLAVGAKELVLEIGIVGRDGIVGLPAFLGDKVAPYRAVVQTGGIAIRMDAKDFDIERAKGETLRRLLLRFAYSSMVQTSLASACHRFHETEKRLVRWLLMTSDRVDTKEIVATHKFLTSILDETPKSVDKAFASLENRRLIKYRRNRFVIPDRAALEAAACKCYATIRNEENSFLAAY